jgi:hypothetical protein
MDVIILLFIREKQIDSVPGNLFPFSIKAKRIKDKNDWKIMGFGFVTDQTFGFKF